MSTLMFNDRVVIVTGAGQGLGTSYAHLLGRLGASVVVNDLSDSALAVADEINKNGGKAIGIAASVTDEADAKRIVDAAIAKFGRVDALINNAGLGYEKAFTEISMDELHKLVNVNLFGTIIMSRAVYPHMAKAGYGRIVNVTSATMFGQAGWAGYAASKAAVLAMSRAVALEWEEAGIKVNILAPGALTQMLRAGIPEEMLDYFKSWDPELVAPVAAYLAHEDVPFTGRAFFSCAGRTAMIQIGTTEGCIAESHTIEEVRDQLICEAMGSNFRAYGNVMEQAAAV